jgi:pimeloyl-ACP methyl ester carboxylesterase
MHDRESLVQPPGVVMQRAEQFRLARTPIATGTVLQYAEQGDSQGEPVVLLHGWPDSWFSFSRVLSSLPATHHAYAIDQRGFGDSERPACCYAIDDLAADVVAFLDGVAVDRANLVGHSLGTFIARRVAETHPERVGRLALIGTGWSTVNEVTLEVAAQLRDLKDPVPTAFAREFQAGTAFLPLPEEFFAGILAERA